MKRLNIHSQGYECPCNYNPADFLIATIAIASKSTSGGGRVAQRICDAFLTSEACNEIDVTLQEELVHARAAKVKGHDDSLRT